MDGLYEFYVQIYNSEVNEEAWAFFLLVDGNVVTDSAHTLVDGLARAITATSTVMLNLVEGQEIWVSPYQIDFMRGSGGDDRMFSWFSGRLIMAP